MNTARKKVIVIGAGPGGLSAAMILAHKGYDVTIYEKKTYRGGRNSALKIDGYTFELGPTFVMLPQAFHEVFDMVGRKLDAYVDMKRLDPLYELQFHDGRTMKMFFDKEKLTQEIQRLFPGEELHYASYMKAQKKKFDRVYACLKVPYMRVWNYLRWKMIKALPVLDAHISVHDVLSRFFTNEDLKISLAFQAKYLGMSPWTCPGTFTILPYIEHAFGIFHPIGGVHVLSEAMARIVEEEGGRIVLGTGVKEILFEGATAVGVILETGEKVYSDAIVMNADFAQGMKDLVPSDRRPKYTDTALAQKDYSCSTFMMYLGITAKYDLPHHKVFFAQDYKKNVDMIFNEGLLPEDPSFYIQNACVTDPSLAPEGCSTLYILVPVPNTKDSQIDWSQEKKRYRDLVLKKIAERTGIADFEKHIAVERVITPDEWKQQAGVYEGAVFNLAHSLDQMLYFRPHNKLEGYDNLYIVGGGTHPGSGLPTIVESGRIAADLISRDL